LNYADVNANDGEPIKDAIKQGNLDIIKLLLENGANIKCGNYYDLRWAVWKNHKEIVELLVANGADVNANDGEPIKDAIKQGNLDVIKLLLENGASVSKALRISQKQGRIEIMEFILKHEKYNKFSDVIVYEKTVYKHACDAGQLKIMKLFEKYSNID